MFTSPCEKSRALEGIKPLTCPPLTSEKARKVEIYRISIVCAADDGGAWESGDRAQQPVSGRKADSWGSAPNTAHGEQQTKHKIREFFFFTFTPSGREPVDGQRS